MASGDPIFLRRTDTTTVVGADKTSLANWLTSVWPGIDGADTDTLDVVRDFSYSGINLAQAAAREKVSTTPSGYFTIANTREDGGIITASGQDVDYYKIHRASVQGSLLLDLRDWILDVFTEPEITAPSLRELIVEKETNGDINATLLYQVTDTVSGYFQLRNDGKVEKLIGTEP